MAIFAKKCATWITIILYFKPDLLLSKVSIVGTDLFADCVSTAHYFVWNNIFQQQQSTHTHLTDFHICLFVSFISVTDIFSNMDTTKTSITWLINQPYLQVCVWNRLSVVRSATNTTIHKIRRKKNLWFTCLLSCLWMGNMKLIICCRTFPSNTHA